MTTGGTSIDAHAVMQGFAARQHGVVTRRQLLRAGVRPDVVDRRVRAGQLRRLLRGAYVMGPVTAPHARAMAVTLLYGDGAVLSHRSAAALWQLLPTRAHDAPIDVIVRSGRGGDRPGIRVRRIGTLAADEVTRHDGIPVTTPARTILDIAYESGSRELELVLARAFAKHAVTPPQLVALLGRHPRYPGAARLRALLDAGQRPALTRSAAEDRFLALLRKARLRVPEVNALAAGYEVDFLWRDERFVVEIDGYAFHGSARMFEQDRRRDAELAAAGLRVVRVTWKQLMTEPEAVVVRLALALAYDRPSATAMHVRA